MNAPKELPEIIDANTASKFFGVAPSTVINWGSAGLIPSYKAGSRWYFRLDAIKSLTEQYPKTTWTEATLKQSVALSQMMEKGDQANERQNYRYAYSLERTLDMIVHAVLILLKAATEPDQWGIELWVARTEIANLQESRRTPRQTG